MTLQHCKTFMIRTGPVRHDYNYLKVRPEVSSDFLQLRTSSSNLTGNLTSTQLYEVVYVFK